MKPKHWLPDNGVAQRLTDQSINVLPIIRQIEASGVRGHRAIAAALNARGVRTARGGDWHATTVRNLMVRRQALEAATGSPNFASYLLARCAFRLATSLATH